VINRLRLQRDPALYAPSYAVLLGLIVSSAAGYAMTQADVVRNTAQLVIGVAVVLTGLHAMVYRHEHTELLKARLHLAHYRPSMLVITGLGMICIGIVFALLAYVGLVHR